MAKIRVEVCLISARGLRRSSSLWKLQWFAVGWIDPNNKYCTKIDASGSSNPTWKTKFSASMGDSESNMEAVALHVEVYSREPIFLREKLYGTATVLLKEFLAKFAKKDSESGIEEIGSFQLRKKSSGKPQGFVDVSIRIFEEREGQSSSYSGVNGYGEGLKLTGHSNDISLAIGDRPGQAYPSQPHPASFSQPQNYPQMISPYYPMPFPANRPNPSVSGPSYRPPSTPPPPPPPSNVGYLPTFLPRTDQLPGTYVNIPSSSGAAPGHSGAPGFGMGVGAGALAAGAVIFGDDFMSGFELPSGLQDASLTISTDPLF